MPSLINPVIEGWTTMALEDCAKFIDYRGRTPKKTESGLRLITAKNAKMGYLQLEPREFVAPESYDAWMTRGIPLKGDVIFTTEAPLGNVCQLDTDEKVVFAQRIITLQTDREVLNPSFLKYTLMSPQMQSIILEQATGATVSGIKAKLLKKVEISFPSLSEQQRIVSILNEAFEKVAITREQAIKKHQDSQDLFQSLLQDVMLGDNDEWQSESLIELSESLHQGLNTAGQKIQFFETGYPIIQTRNITNGVIDLEEKIKFVGEEDWNKYQEKYKPKTGDIFFTNIGTIGKTAVVFAEEDYLIHWNIFKIRPKKNY